MLTHTSALQLCSPQTVSREPSFELDQDEYIPLPRIPVEETQASNGVVAFLEDQVEQQGEQEEEREPSQPETPAADEEGDEQEEEEEEEDSDDDIEIVTEAPTRSLDFRQNRPVTNRIPSTNIPTQPRAQALAAALTTEYTPIARGAPTPSAQSGTPAATQQSFGSAAQPQQQQQQSAAQGLPQSGGATALVQDTAEGVVPDDGVDPTTLPPAKAPPSHPSIDPTETGIYDGRSILEYDMNALADKPWRRPGSDISDWFNYGFDEISWEAYCYRRRDLGELAHVLKANVINFTAMSEDQITGLPAEMRGMAITSANNLMNQATQMMVPGVMDMSGMVGPMGMGMNPGDMGMGGGMMPGMMQQEQNGVAMMQGAGVPGDVQQQGQVAPGGMMQDASGAYVNPNAAAGMMNMGMADYGMQDQNQMVQPMYQGMDVSQGVAPVQGGSGRGTPLAPTAPARPASPLPPNVPTGPRNQNKYKDRDGNAPAVDGLDYGGGGGGRRTPSHEPEDRTRKRRSSPGLDDGRSSKRR
ncbi:hypothetical protein EST38_g2789 [Candolleomyces aberdarensis]|uniref:Pre-mRNA polyadenylation factor Fip1 domain-containing protein n=1 Tax=Candolleomyces aberdarensis TaxID=2316362 RepID=A0A4Q2DVV2_9AGAR|nr:hypothetical protein EST38_g2789 [Candolleomyces aberdarensis]